MRAFFAIELTPQVRRSLVELRDELASRLDAARFVPPQNLHLTLRFVREAAEDAFARLVSRLRPKLRLAPRFDLHFRGVGAFPNARRPRVLWVGVVGPPQALFDLRILVERFAVDAGFPPDERDFEPHLTLARFRSVGRNLGSLISALSDREVGRMHVTDLSCFESRLSPGGASYRLIDKLPLSFPGRE